ncbi:NucA/NucB deoxyribonuclease domain-containing protein (plasmid) [Streptomyces sp. NBC_01166]|uniref:NucA/NucB deoxyribonuclease domain-containing protein n=1 Tax=Streptomyces sp. NBC_01166 TaxID=2903755 RepID=UPI002F91B200|nr:NucA/NucB deoxyribonuclease domain-containing protein [Streptomyces sp. NBC_01166]
MGTAAALLTSPAHLATAQPAPANTYTQFAGPSTAETTTITMRVGVSQETLAELRAQGSRAQAEGTTGLPKPAPTVQSAKRPASGETSARSVRPALTLLSGQQASNAAATANPQPSSQAEGPGSFVAAPIGDRPDPALSEACFKGDNVETGIGRVFNRFTYCTRVNVEAVYWSIDAKGIPIEEEGTTTAKLEVFSQGDDHDRRARVFAQIQKDSVDYDWGPLDNIFVAPNVPLSLLGQCVQDSDVCHASRGAYTMPWTTWDNNPDWAYWDVYNHERVSEGRDKISYNQWRVELYTDNEEYKTLVRGRTPARMLRCDSAAYFNLGKAKYPQACIFSEVTPYLTYTLGSTHHAVAEHIDTAHNRPNTTYPLLAPPGVPWPRDKNIPGKYIAGNPDAPGLHRITKKLHPAESKANKDHKDGACFKTGPERLKYLDTGLPTRPSSGEQCDEYPFASTLEGAGHPRPDFSVKSIPATDNRVAGGMLRKYYVDDRVLAWDPTLPRPYQTNDRFYVQIQ